MVRLGHEDPLALSLLLVDGVWLQPRATPREVGSPTASSTEQAVHAPMYSLSTGAPILLFHLLFTWNPLSKATSGKTIIQLAQCH